MNRSLFLSLFLLLASACAPAPNPTPPGTQAPVAATATVLPPTTVSNPTLPPPEATAASPTLSTPPSADVTSLLAQQLKNDLSAHPRPACQAGTNNESEWADYGRILATALGNLVSDPRGQSLSWQTLVGIFEQGSGLSLDTVESSGDARFVTIVKANCDNRIGGGDSPAAPRDAVYVVDRHGDMWIIGAVANVLGAVWSGDHWIVLVTQAEYGGGSTFEIWHVTQAAGVWGYGTKFRFSQAASEPVPHLSADGNSITLYSPPAACNLPDNIVVSNPTIESDYQWQNGEYHCVNSRVLPTPTPSP